MPSCSQAEAALVCGLSDMPCCCNLWVKDNQRQRRTLLGAKTDSVRPDLNTLLNVPASQCGLTVWKPELNRVSM